MGHSVVTIMAYEQLTPEAKVYFNRLNQAASKVYPARSLVSASIWLDYLRYKDVNWYSSYHYVDDYFSPDGSTLPMTQTHNALWALQQAQNTLLSKKASAFDQGIALRIMLHVVADIHQPLHTLSRVTAQNPHGDKGGNAFALAHNSVADNLHAYWDRGAGLLLSKKKKSRAQSYAIAKRLAIQYPCTKEDQDFDYPRWAQESRHIALNQAYTIKEETTPSHHYQQEAQKQAQHRLSQAACRLAHTLNTIYISHNLAPIGRSRNVGFID